MLALIQREDVRLTKLAAQLPGAALQSSKVKQLHRFFKNIRLSEDVLARFVLSFSDPTERLWLVIDRTNWRLGSTELKILLVAVILKGQALPLMWTLLPHGAAVAQLYAMPSWSVCCWSCRPSGSPVSWETANSLGENGSSSSTR
ncbi:hypothetical protein [Deinococcus ruber]|uniref:Uncharacterized protein n=1 Tax=Deinococcus ruber TaxID=1848197 RepID=A0A918CLM6_9DEIO|nr:hypothetical protein [Deinococcus ruber]GGR29190.1 hypothetical protein GCM10008957_45230 [Deinococcus ruber]